MHGGMDSGTVVAVVSRMVTKMAMLMGNGYSVTIDGLGTFKASLGLEKDKEMDTFDGEESKRNARSLRLNGICYRADRTLIKEANKHCKLEREGDSRLHRSPYTKEQRLELALRYLEEKGMMRVVNYMELTGLSRTKATLELKEFRQDVSTGIASTGRRSALVYVKRDKI